MSHTRRDGPRCYNPALVRLPDGTYGTFPFGHPMPEGDLEKVNYLKLK